MGVHKPTQLRLLTSILPFSVISLSCSFLSAHHPVRCFTEAEALPNITKMCMIIKSLIRK